MKNGRLPVSLTQHIDLTCKTSARPTPWDFGYASIDFIQTRKHNHVSLFVKTRQVIHSMPDLAQVVMSKSIVISIVAPILKENLKNVPLHFKNVTFLRRWPRAYDSPLPYLKSVTSNLPLPTIKRWGKILPLTVYCESWNNVAPGPKHYKGQRRAPEKPTRQACVE